MSALTSDLPKKTVLAWRSFLGTTEGQYGIDWLRRNYKRLDGENDMQMIRNASIWSGYMAALEDIEDRLTLLPTTEKSLDEAPLELPDSRD
jgi:hypothetical protein